MQTVLLHFLDELRAVGVRISPSESIDALQSAASIGIERELLREALAVSVIKDEKDRPLFDAIFAQFFAVPGLRPKSDRAASFGEGRGWRTRGDSARSISQQPPRAESPATALRSSPQDKPKGQEQFLERLTGESTAAETAHHDNEHGVQFAQHKALLTKPFQSFDARTVEAVSALVEELSRRLKAHLSRRYTRRRHGRLDFRRTIRASISHGGVPLDLFLRGRKPGKLDLLVLCDVSGSVSLVSDFLLALVSPAGSYFRQVRTFAYIDRVCEVSFEHGHVVPHDAMLDLYALSDFGQVLQHFLRTYGQQLLSRNTVVLVLGDARNNRRPPRPDLLARIRQQVKSLVWLNPEPTERWDTGDSVMSKYAPVCDSVLACGDLELLLRALKYSL